MCAWPCAYLPLKGEGETLPLQTVLLLSLPGFSALSSSYTYYTQPCSLQVQGSKPNLLRLSSWCRSCERNLMLAEVAYLIISLASWSMNEVAREVSVAATSLVDYAGWQRSVALLSRPKLAICLQPRLSSV